MVSPGSGKKKYHMTRQEYSPCNLPLEASPPPQYT